MLLRLDYYHLYKVNEYIVHNITNDDDLQNIYYMKLK